MPGMTIDDLVAHVNGTIDDPRVGVEAYMANEASNVSTMDNMGYRLIESTIRTMQNETLVAPYLVQGGTDAKHFTALSDSIYRFMMVELNPETLKQFHGVNEQIPITDYISAIQFYGELIKQSAQGSVHNQ
jgi:carboxypeptidase PM20D1